MELKVTKERVLEAAASCGDAKTVLKKLFPEAFEADYMKISVDQKIMSSTGTTLLCRRNSGNYDGSVYLNNNYTWSFVKDSEGQTVLVAKAK